MTTTTSGQQSEETKQYDVVGTRPIRHDGVDKVIGAAKYGADVKLSGMLHGKVLRSPHAHARIRSIDSQKMTPIRSRQFDSRAAVSRRLLVRRVGEGIG